MKQKSLALFTLALTFATCSFAQSLHVGAKAGANVFKVDGKSFKEEFRFGYNVGAFAEIFFDDKWGIQPEVMWNQTNFRTDSNFSALYTGGASDFKGKLNYLSVPVLLCFRPAKVITFQAGPQFGILVNKDQSLFQNGKTAFKSGDFSMLGGVQVNVGSIRVGGRYVIGLTNINDIDNKDKWKNQGFQLYVGLKII